MVSKKVTAALLFAPLALGVALARAQEAPAPSQEAASPTKIGFVDVEKAVTGIAEGKARLGALQEWSKPRQQELQKLNEEITALQGQIAARAGAASEEGLADLNRQLKLKQREFEDKQRSGRRDFEERQTVILKDIGNKLNQVITAYADSNRYTAVFIIRPNDIAYLANSADITDTVVKLYDEKYPFPPPKTGAASK